MSDGGAARFSGGSLDPTAQEFRPRICPRNPLIHLPMVQPQIYYSYSTPVTEFHIAPSFYHALPSPHPAPLQPPPPSPAPTRALLLTSVPYNVSESEIRRELEIFGDVRAVQMERLLRDGIVTVHFYDLRHARSALEEIRGQHMMQQSRLRHHFESLIYLQNSIYAVPPPPPLPPLSPGLISGHAVWAQYTIPSSAILPDGLNQGTIVVFNLDSNVSTAHLREIFQGFGAVKEFRETPMKPNQRFVEFYDSRDAARALAVMNGGEISGRQVVIEFSRPGGGHGRRFTKHHHHHHQNNNSNNNNYQLIPSRNFRFSPPSPPPPPPRSTLMYSSRNTDIVTATGAGAGAAGEDDQLELEKMNFGKAAATSASSASKKNAKKCQSNNMTTTTSSSSNKGGLKGPGKNMDPRFLIDEDAIMDPTNCRDPRTTVMIKNIPNKYSQKLLLNMLDNHCITNNEKISKAGGCGGEAGGEGDQPFSAYDFIYLPIDFTNKCNVGYGFVNMTTPQATWRLYKAFHHQNWEVFNSKKICQVTYARLQGLEALKEHFKNSKFPCESEDYLPVIFSPPRDGKLLSEPLPIVHLSYSSTTSTNFKQAEEDLREAAVSDEMNVHRSSVGGGVGGGENDDDDEDDECDSPKEEEEEQ